MKIPRKTMRHTIFKDKNVSNKETLKVTYLDLIWNSNVIGNVRSTEIARVTRSSDWICVE